MQLGIIAAILVAIGGVAFALQNNVPVTVNFIVWRFDSSLAMVLLLALAVGAIIVALITTPGTLRRQWHEIRLRKRIDELDRHCRELDEALARCRAGEATIESDETQRPYVGLKQILAGTGKDRADSGSGSDGGA